jgi:hypothetical protein
MIQAHHFPLVKLGYFVLFRCHDQKVIPTRMIDATSQAMKYTVGKAPPFAENLMKAIIPVTTTMMVNVSGTLRDSFIRYSPFLIIYSL